MDFVDIVHLGCMRSTFFCIPSIFAGIYHHFRKNSAPKNREESTRINKNVILTSKEGVTTVQKSLKRETRNAKKVLNILKLSCG